MITCSLGHVNNAIITRSLSGLTYVSLVVPIDSYNDSPKFELVTDSIRQEYRIVSNDVHMQSEGKTVMSVMGMLESQYRWAHIKPSSIDSGSIEDVLKSLGLSNGPSVQVSYVNVFLNDMQLAISLANMSPKLAFVDFENNSILYFSDLYKKKPLSVQGTFRRIYTTPTQAGFTGWDTSGNVGSYADGVQTILPMGNFTNLDRTHVENLLRNCNELSSLVSDMQVFTASHRFDLGDTVISNLTYDKKIIVAAEERFEINDCVTGIYYCI